jgi:hypothetical protein
LCGVALDADEILTRSGQLEKIDTIARRTFGLNNAGAITGALNLNTLASRSVLQVAPSVPATASRGE